MVRLTPELIHQSMQYLNPCRDRELSLRGYRIPMIENLGATVDQFDAIDFSDNDIRKLDGFPFLKRLKTLLFNHNPIMRIEESLEQYIPNLETLVLTGCLIPDLGDLNPLATLPNLRFLSLLTCPVTHQQHYREYVIFKIPQLKVLDFRKIKQKEREQANALFKSKTGKELQKTIVKKSRFVPGGNLPPIRKPSGQRTDDVRKIREAIAKATSLEEVERLNHMLQSGQIPGNTNYEADNNGMEYDDDEEQYY